MSNKGSRPPFYQVIEFVIFPVGFLPAAVAADKIYLPGFPFEYSLPLGVVERKVTRRLVYSSVNADGAVDNSRGFVEGSSSITVF